MPEDLSRNKSQTSPKKRSPASSPLYLPFKKPKHKKLAFHWFLKNTITLPGDHEVVEKAIQFAENKKLDPMAYDNPRELSEQLLDKSINPDKIPPQFTNKKVFKKAP